MGNDFTGVLSISFPSVIDYTEIYQGLTNYTRQLKAQNLHWSNLSSSNGKITGTVELRNPIKSQEVKVSTLKGTGRVNNTKSVSLNANQTSVSFEIDKGSQDSKIQVVLKPITSSGGITYTGGCLEEYL